MKVAVIVIGDELLLGQVTDTNSGDIARHIAPAGWEVDYVQTVGDDPEEIHRAIDRGFSSASVVLTTGGLGPTKDDITKSVLRDYFGGELRQDPAVLANVEKLMERRGIKLNELTAAQAIVPTSCQVIQNRVGTAPIMWFEKDGRVLVAMPGVPFETREMFAAEVFPRLLAKFGEDMAICHAVVMVTDYTESALAEKIASWEESLPPYLHLAYLPKPGLIRLRIDGMGKDAELIGRETERARRELCEMLGEAVIADSDLTPAQIVLSHCRRLGITLSTAESFTGGNIAHEITTNAGCSEQYVGSVVSYSNHVKEVLLGVSHDTLTEHGAVSEQVAAQMAMGVCHATGAALGISTTGIAGPGGGSDEKPVGTVCIGIALTLPDGAQRVVTDTFHFTGNRIRVIDTATSRALILAAKELRKLP